MTDTPVTPPPTPPVSSKADEGGVPLWLPLVAGVIALAFAVFVAARIGPTLSALVTPPDPVLPANSVLKLKESVGTRDEWVYEAPLSACEVVKIYETAFKPFEGGGCVFSPTAGCRSGGMGGGGPRSAVARCGGKQTISNFNIQWSVVIAVGDTSQKTSFRIYREVN
jgi:hypothetical protein